MIDPLLYPAVLHLALQMQGFNEADLEQPWAWGPHDEGVRFALLGTFQELQQCAVTILAERTQAARPVTQAQHILAQYHVAYRDVEALLLGVTEAHFNQPPGPAEWPLLSVLAHMVGVERNFFTLVQDAVQRVRNNENRSPALPDGAVDRVVGPYAEFEEIIDAGRLSDLWAYYANLHNRALIEFAGISDAELEAQSLWWEEINFPVRHRLHRFTAHLFQHTIQAEKTLVAIGQQPNEARRLLRRVFRALAEVEGLLIGAPDTGREARAALAEVINRRTTEVVTIVRQTHALQSAVNMADLDQIRSLLAEHPELSEAVGINRLSLVLNAAYRHQPDVVQALVEAGAYQGIYEAAATGRLDIVQQAIGEWSGWLNRFNTDGFNPLQLACYFGQDEVAAWLVDQGADVNAEAQNGTGIRPVHAAAASGSMAALSALLDRGADVNAAQEGGFTPLHQAAHRGDDAMAALFLAYGADRALTNDQGQTPSDVALADGHPDLANILDPAG